MLKVPHNFWQFLRYFRAGLLKSSGNVRNFNIWASFVDKKTKTFIGFFCRYIYIR